MKRAPRVAVIGAGVAGLTCARDLALRSAEVTVFDKGRSPGGRLMTRRVPPHSFDLGAQYFTVHDPRFSERVREWTNAGVCEPWRGRLVASADARAPFRALTSAMERFVARPGMSALARHLATDLTLRASQRVERIVRRGAELRLSGSVGAPGVTVKPSASSDGGEDFGAYDHVALCVPSTQAAALLAELNPSLAAQAASVRMEPCVAVGFAVADENADELCALPFDGAFIGRGDAGQALTWLARDSSKPGRPEGERWVLHATPSWSRRHFELSDAELSRALLDEFAARVGIAAPSPTLGVVQRWGLARAMNPLGGEPLHDATLGVGLAGDWAGAGQVEGAFLSGLALAARILGHDG